MSELFPYLLSGGLGALASALACSVIWGAIELWRPNLAKTWSAGGALSSVGVFMHFVAGMLLGVTFWLSWGLAALLDLPWWQRGFVFGGLAWAAMSLPCVVTSALARGLAWQTQASLLAQWAGTCVIASLSCAWTWQVVTTA